MHPFETSTPSPRTQDALVCEVLPAFGLAFFTDGKTRTWGATRATPGPSIEALSEGQRVRLFLVDQDGFTIVHRYELAQ